MSIPKPKDDALDNVEDKEEENVAENSDEDFEDVDFEADLLDVLRRAFSRLSTRQDELARRQQLQVVHLE